MSGQSEQMLDKLNQNKTNLVDQRLLTITLIAFCGFMRFSETSTLRCSGLVFSSTCVKVFIEKIKTDIYRDEMWICIPASGKIFPLKKLNITWLSQKYPNIQRS